MNNYTECQPKHVLIVTADNDIRDVLTDRLAAERYEVCPHFGAEALNCPDSDIAIVDLDARLYRDPDRMSLLRSLCRRMPVIVLYGHQTDEGRMQRAGVSLFAGIMKPYEADEILRELRKALDRVGAEKALLIGVGSTELGLAVQRR